MPSVIFSQFFGKEIFSALNDIKKSRPSQSQWIDDFLIALDFGKDLAKKADKKFFSARLAANQSFRQGSSFNSLINSTIDSVYPKSNWENVFQSLCEELSHGILGGFEYTHEGSEWGPYTVDHGFVRSIMPSPSGFVSDKWDIMRFRTVSNESFVGWLPDNPEDPENASVRILGFITTRSANSPRLAKDFVQLVQTLYDRADVVEGKIAVRDDPDFVSGGSITRYEPTDSFTICGKRKLSRLGRFYSKLGGIVLPEGNSDSRVYFYRDQNKAIQIHGPDCFKYINQNLNIYK